MPSAETWTIGRLLNWTQGYLKDRGADTPRLDAELLLASALGCPRIDLYTRYADEPSEPSRQAFRELVRRRAEGMPVAYLLGRREFYSLDFLVTPDVLIPRPETELLLVSLLDLAKKHFAAQEGLRVADIGTGSGILAVCVAKYLKGAKVSAVDISAAALEVARRNASTHGVAERIDFLLGDLLEAVPAESRFDLIASNPPYVSESEALVLPKDVRDFEPRVALVAGPTGTEVIARIVSQAITRLAPRGWLLLEISPMIEPAVRDLFAAQGRFELLPTVTDFAGLPRVVCGRLQS